MKMKALGFHSHSDIGSHARRPKSSVTLSELHILYLNRLKRVRGRRRRIGTKGKVPITVILSPPPSPSHMNSFCGLNIGLIVELNAVVNVCLSPVVSAWRSSRNAIKRALLLITLRCQTAEKQNPLHGNEVERPAAINATRHTKQDTLGDRLGKLRFLFKANTFLKETLGLTRTDLTVMLYTVKNYIP